MNPMLLQFFGLRDQPFGVTPDPRYLYESHTHREALASLLYGLSSDRGFFALVGKPGMGKTTLLFRLLEQYRHSALTAFLFQTQCDSREFLSYLFADLGIESFDSSSLVTMHHQFNELLEDRARAGQRCIIVIDEAQNLDNRVLETVRLLSDFETARTKLLQIIIAGQPALGDKLADPSLAQLRQRISMLCRLTPLSEVEVDEYISYRLRVAGYKGDKLFLPEARARIAGLSEGIPRVISNLCFNAMSLAYAMGQREVTPEIVEEIGSDLGLVNPQEAASNRQTAESSVRPQATHAAGVERAASDLGGGEPVRTPPGPIGAPRANVSGNNAAFSGGFAAASPAPSRSVPSASRSSPGRTRSETAQDSGAPSQSPRPRRGGHPRRLVERSVIALACGSVVIAIALSWFVHRTDHNATVRQKWDSGISTADTADLAGAERAGPGGETDRAQISATDPALAPVNTRPVVGESQADAERVATNKDADASRHLPQSAGLSLQIHQPTPTVRLHKEADPAPPVPSTPATGAGLSRLPLQSASLPTLATPARSPSMRKKSMQSPTAVGRLASMVKPVYPDAASAAGVEGTVVLQALVDADGVVKQVRVLEGKPLLQEAAVDAVKGWRYYPYFENGEPVIFQTIIRIRFVLDSVLPES